MRSSLGSVHEFANQRLQEIGHAGEWTAITLVFLALCSIGRFL